MTKKAIFIAVIFALTTSLFAQKPNWTDFDQRQQMYPKAEFFIGFSMEEVDKSEDLGQVFERLKQNATGNLSNSG
jgi:hypothetical protein